jgi:hypothetical protein
MRVPLLFLYLVGLASALVVPQVPVNCQAAWVPPLVRLVDNLPDNQGIEFCSSAVGKYFTAYCENSSLS